MTVGCGGAPEVGTGGGTGGSGPDVPDAGRPDSNGVISTPDAAPRSDVVRPRPTDDSCVRFTCSTDAGVYCGQIGDGCGGTLDCGNCTGSQVCVQNVCSTPVDGCAPLTCAQVGGTYCGAIGDGCGRLLDCGACPSPFTCGGGGISNVCGASSDSGACSPTNCTQATGQYCGVVGDGCGGKMDCGNCDPGQSCGAAGIPGLCGYFPDSGNCMPTNCRQPNGKYCGVVGNGCGGQVDCGNCDAGQTCGGAGIDGVCGASPDSGYVHADELQPADRQVLRHRGRRLRRQDGLRRCTGGYSCGGDGVPERLRRPHPILVFARSRLATRPTVSTVASWATAAAAGWTAPDVRMARAAAPTAFRICAVTRRTRALALDSTAPRRTANRYCGIVGDGCGA